MIFQIWFDPDDASLVMGLPERLAWDRRRGSLGPRARCRQQFWDDSWDAAQRTFQRYRELGPLK